MPPIALAPGEALAEGAIPSSAERVRGYARWLIWMRWMAVAVAACAVLVVVELEHMLPRRVLWPLSATIMILAGLNCIYLWLSSLKTPPRWLLPAQLYVDLVLLTVLLHFSGGIENLLALLMVLHVIIGGIILSRRQCFMVAAAASVLYATLAWAEWSGVVQHYTLHLFPHYHTEEGPMHAAHISRYVFSAVGLQWAIFFLTAYFVSALAQRLRANEQQLSALAARATAQRHLLERSLETTGTALRVLDSQLRPFWSNELWQAWLGADCAVDPAAAQTLEDRGVHVVERQASPPQPHGGAQPEPPLPQRQRTWQLTTAPLLATDGSEGGRHGRVEQVVELAQDITKQKELQTRLLRAGTLAAVGELAGQVAHEVNNPIAIISAKVRLLLNDPKRQMSEKTATELTKILDLADRVARIAQGLLSYCRPSTGRRRELDLCLPVRKALGMVEPRAAAAGVQTEDRLPERLPPVIANSGEMEQVFTNLFLNALDAMPSGGRLSVGGEAADQFVRILIRDTGGGIDPELREKIFEPFFSTKQEGRGTGLGLSICLGLVRSHGGQIDVESEGGRGSCFTVRLPRQGSGTN